MGEVKTSRKLVKFIYISDECICSTILIILPNSASFFYFQHNSIERFQSNISFCASSCLEQKHLSNFQWNSKQITVSQKHASCAKPQPAIPSSFVFDFLALPHAFAIWVNIFFDTFPYLYMFAQWQYSIPIIIRCSFVLHLLFLCTHLCFFFCSFLVFESINRFVHLIICKWLCQRHRN